MVTGGDPLKSPSPVFGGVFSAYTVYISAESRVVRALPKHKWYIHIYIYNVAQRAAMLPPVDDDDAAATTTNQNSA